MAPSIQKVGSEFLVNTTYRENQSRSTIASLSDGGFVVSWDDSGSINPDSTEVRVQQFDASGAKVGNEILVNPITEGGQYSSSVIGLANGGFMVSWIDQGRDELDNTSIKAQAFDVSGTRVGGEVQLTSDAIRSTMTSLSNGGFVISWVEDSDITAQVFDASGVKVGGEILVNTMTTDSQDDPTITGLSNGGFVASWTDYSRADDPDWSGIKAQVFDASGAKVGGEVLVNTATTERQIEPSIASLADGGFVVSWTDYLGDMDQWGIKAQLFDAAGAKVDDEFVVNTATVNRQFDPAVTSLLDGGFVVSWTDYSLNYSATTSIKAQAFDASGAKVGGEVRVNTTKANGQFDSAITVLQDGSLAVSWTDFSLDETYDVRAQVLRIAEPKAVADTLGDPGKTPVYDGDAARIDVAGLLANDTDGDLLRFSSIVGATTRGTLELVTEGGQTFLTYHYDGPQLAAGAIATDSFTYRAAHTFGATSTATVTLTVTGLAAGSPIQGGSSSTTIRGSDLLHDTVRAGGGNDVVYGRDGRDQLWGEDGDDQILGGDGADVAYGGAGRDTLEGDAGNDSLHGERDNDSLSGEDGADNLYGGSGNDSLIGGEGSDRLFAGQDGSQDMFVYRAVSDSLSASRDLLYEFDRGEDLIDLRAIDARAGSSTTNNVFDYSGTKAAANSVWWTRNGDSVVVSADTTGDKSADFQVRLAGVTQLSADDFLL